MPAPQVPLIPRRYAKQRFSLLEQLGEVFGREGFAEIVALYPVAAVLAQVGKLLFVLHAFRDHLEAQVVRESDDGASDGRVVGIDGNVPDERPVCLKVSSGKRLR